MDQLSGTFPNASFTIEARNALAAAGYSVDYYSPDRVTVDFFRSLPKRGYGIVIIRAHSTGYAPIPGQEISIFTSETYNSKDYLYEQLTGQVYGASLRTLEEAAILGDGPLYFSIAPRFVRDSMQGSFPSSIVIMMGCTGLEQSDTKMAQAFLERGASVYVSWDNSVTPVRTDEATVALLRSLTSGRSVGEAVNTAMGKVGPDFVYNSHLAFYPEDQGGLVVTLPQREA